MEIPFNKPFIIGKELYYVAQSVLTGQIAGDGVFTKKCHELLEERFNANKILLTTSCTAALEMAAMLFNVGPEDEVILPSFTFVSTANAFYVRGAKLIFVDIRPDTLNIDETCLEKVITERTKVIVPVHYAGVACNMDRIMEIAKQNNIYIVEDAAHGMDGTYKGRKLGTIGDIGAFSFHETKNCICGEGGAIAINNPKFKERAEIIREKGTNRSQFFRGQVDKYTWVDIGSSYLPSDLLAAFLYAQLENIDIISAKRRVIYEFYMNGFRKIAERDLVQLPFIPSDCRSSYHLFHIIVQTNKLRDGLLGYLKSKGICAVFHYLPLHTSPVGLSMGYTKGHFPVTESISDRLLRLPFYYDLQVEQQKAVIDYVNDFLLNNQ